MKQQLLSRRTTVCEKHRKRATGHNLTCQISLNQDQDQGSIGGHGAQGAQGGQGQSPFN